MGKTENLEINLFSVRSERDHALRRCEELEKELAQLKELYAECKCPRLTLEEFYTKYGR